jgi:hypothetical protein
VRSTSAGDGLAHRGALGEAEHAQVGARVAPDDRGAGARAAGEGHRHVVVAVHGVVRGDDDARAPEHPRGGDAAAGVQGHRRAAGAGDGVGEGVGERLERGDDGDDDMGSILEVVGTSSRSRVAARAAIR